MSTLLIARDRSVFDAVDPRPKTDGAVFLSGESPGGEVDGAAGSCAITPAQHAAIKETARTTVAHLAFGGGDEPGFLDWPQIVEPVLPLWLVEPPLIRSLVRVLTSAREARNVIEAAKPAQCQLAEPDPLRARVIKDVLTRAGAEVSILPTAPGVREHRHIPGARRGEETLRRLAARFRGIPEPKSRDKKMLAFVSFSGFWRQRDSLEPDVGAYTDVYIGDLIDGAHALDEFWPLVVAVRRARGPMTVTGSIRHVKRLLSGTLPYVPLEAFWDNEVRDAFHAAQAWAKERNAQIEKRFPANGEPEPLAGTGLWKHVLPALRRAVIEVPIHVERHVLMRNMIRRLQPAAVVQYGEAEPGGRALTWACHAENVPSAAVQYGVGVEHFLTGDRSAARTRRGGDPNGPPVPDASWVFGPPWARRLTTLGYPPDSIEQTGFHRLDRIFAARRGVEPKGRSVLFVSFPMPPHRRKAILGALARIKEERPSMRVRVKGHPRDFDSQQRLAEAGMPVGIEFLPVSEPLRPHVLDSDLIVTGHSTALLEAAAGGQPVVCAFPPAIREPDLIATGLAAVAHTDGELATALRRLSDDPKARAGRVKKADAALSGLLGSTSPNVTARLIERIAALAKSL